MCILDARKIFILICIRGIWSPEAIFLKYPILNLIHEKVKEKQNFTDVELLGEINKDGADLTMRDLNKGLLNLEIMGLVQVTWMGKNKRRIELVQPKEER